MREARRPLSTGQRLAAYTQCWLITINANIDFLLLVGFLGTEQFG